MIEVPSMSITRPFEESIFTTLSVLWEESKEVLSFSVVSLSTVPKSLRETTGVVPVPESSDFKEFDTLW